VSLLYRVVFAAAAKNTHHRLVLDALRQLRLDGAERWRDVFLYHYEAFLRGAKAPDDEFKDFKNHVLHVQDNYWGGAIRTAELWYKLTVDALRLGDFKEAVYSAGVLSHYVTDPFMPLHTGQTETEGKIHRACEWSIAQSYVELQNIVEQDLGGYPVIETPTGSTWLADLIRFGAEQANDQYQACLDHYNLALGVKNPPQGLDQELKDRIARQIGLAAVAVARVIEHAIADAAAAPPTVSLTVETFLSTSIVPIFWITKKLADLKDRAAVEAIFDEVQRTGKAVATLPEDERAVRKLHAEQVLHKPLRELDAEKPRPTGAQFGQGAAPRVRPNKARILQLPSALSLPKLPTVRGVKVSVPSTAAMREKLSHVHMPESLKKLKLPKMAMPKMSVPKLTGEQLAAAKKRLSEINFRSWKVPGLGKLKKRKQVVDELEKQPTPKPAVEPPMKTPVKTPRKQVPSDLDTPKRPAGASSSMLRGEPPVIRRTDAAEAAPPPPTEARREATGGKLKFHLSRESPIEDAPSIGPKTAKRFEALGIRTVADLLECDPAKTAAKLKASFIDAGVVRRWQKQAQLVCRVPRLRGHDAQILVGCGVDDAEELAARQAASLLSDVEDFLSTQEGEKALRNNPRPDLAEVGDWIAWAGDARRLQDA